MTRPRFGSKPSGLLALPRMFFEDHVERFPASFENCTRGARFVWVQKDDPGLGNLVNDAEYYADPAGPDTPHLRAAAKRLLATIDAQLPSRPEFKEED